jgi:hypothetical protein
MKKLVVLIAASLIFFGGCSKKKDENTIVSFKDGTLSFVNLIAHSEEMKKIKVFSKKDLDLDDVLEHAVNMEMIIKEGIEKKLHLNPELRAKLHMQMASVFLEALKNELVPEIKRDSISDKEVKEYYMANKTSYDQPDKYSFYLIKSLDGEDLEKLVSQFETNEITIDIVKTDHETEFRSKSNILFLDPVLKDTLEKSGEKKISSPIDYKNSRYLVYIDEIIKGKPCDFEKKKEYIRNDVLYSKYKKAWQNTYENLREKYGVEIDTASFEKLKKELEEKNS